ncbi:MAG: methylene-tetrahydromethanopterin dehydrogenase N-terminal domain-containing protein [Planctomycetaceae bacterium]
MPKRVLLQLDCDPQPSTFDAVVAVDAGVDVLLRHGGVTPENAVPLVHGVMFTRGGADLASTAIFVGGSDVAAAEAVAARVRDTFFGSARVGVLLDPSGATTTAAAAVVAAGRHLALEPGAVPRCRALGLGGTGPVGRRVTRLLARRGAAVHVASRSLARAEAAAGAVGAQVAGADVRPLAWPATLAADGAAGRVLVTADLVVAAGAAGAVLLDAGGRGLARAARVLVDLNAVPPAGIAGIVPTDEGRRDGAALLYGAVGVGGLKMAIHRAAIERIYAEPAAFLDADDLLALGQALA